MSDGYSYLVAGPGGTGLRLDSRARSVYLVLVGVLTVCYRTMRSPDVGWSENLSQYSDS